MTAIDQTDGDAPDDLPLLTSVVGEATLNDLPTLTEVVAETAAHLSCALSEEEIQQLLHRLEAHLETALTQKFGLRLEQLQRQAIEQAVSELKTELPKLLREALGTRFESR